VALNYDITYPEQVERTKFKYYQLYRKTVTDKNYLFSSHKVLRIFSKFFRNFLISYFLILLKITMQYIKKLIKNFEKFLKNFYEKKINDFYLLQFVKLIVFE